MNRRSMIQILCGVITAVFSPFNVFNKAVAGGTKPINDFLQATASATTLVSQVPYIKDVFKWDGMNKRGLFACMEKNGIRDITLRADGNYLMKVNDDRHYGFYFPPGHSLVVRYDGVFYTACVTDGFLDRVNRDVANRDRWNREFLKAGEE